MASSYQQQALQRKLIYAGLILALFTAAWGWRHYVVDAQAADLAIREQTRGEVELTGAIVRLGLTGSRGAVTCGLWWMAMEKQKKNQWNELEVLVTSLTRLQPHFIRPWLFQSWNLAYNVSVEADRVSDRYFFITRGINLLRKGELQNQNYPDLRWYIGFYGQHKICQSDDTNTLRSLAQLSCIPPNKRDPARFQRLHEGKPEMNEEELEKFCQENPQLVRRLREGMRRENERDQKRQFTCAEIEDVLVFLADNYRLPSRWEDASMAPVGAWQSRADKLKPVTEQFPLLPPYRKSVPAPQHIFDPSALHDQSDLTDEDDPFQVSRAWYCYAQEPVPDAGEMPGTLKEVSNRAVQRRPRQLAPVLFCAYPAHAQRYTAERLEQEGWFDEEGYEIPGWFKKRTPAPIGGGRKWSQEAWQRALSMWERMGRTYHLLLSASEEDNLTQLAHEYAESRHLPVDMPPPQVNEETLTDTDRKRYRAALFLQRYTSQRTTSGFPFHYARAEAESKDATITARKLFFQAEQLHRNGSRGPALDLYNDPRGLRAWRDKVLLEHKVFRDDPLTQEQNFELQLRYNDLYMGLNEVELARQRAALSAAPMHCFLGTGIAPLALTTCWTLEGRAENRGQVSRLRSTNPLLEVEVEYRPRQKVHLSRPKWYNPLLGGFFDGTDREGRPLISNETRTQVLQRRHLIPASGPQAPPKAAQMPPAETR